MFLSDEEVVRLTGYRRQADQIRWLREHGIEPFVSRDGVSVTRDVVELALRVRSRLAVVPVRRGPAPNLKAAS
jgi:hypothetical protein